MAGEAAVAGEDDGESEGETLTAGEAEEVDSMGDG